MQALIQLIDYLWGGYIFILLLRFILQKCQASWYNPVTKLTVSLTDPIVKVARRFIPGYKGFDFSILIVAWIFAMIELYLIGWMQFGVTLHVGGVIAAAWISLFIKMIYIFLISIVVMAFLSWFATARHSPLSDITNAISAPLLRIVQRFVPVLSSGVDLSALVAIIGLYLMLTFIFDPLWRLGMQWAVS